MKQILKIDVKRCAKRPVCSEAPAMVYTMVEMAKAHNLNIYKYLTFLLEHLPRTVVSDDGMAALVPWNENVQEHCAGSL
ncbi:MAG: transposase domain-containing protein [Lachnospiraceae bacterium]|nr:transposase domain-containing protein [Lachnospiraceae bacterium]